jgi:DNA-binding NarL/FixJ family response regulator
MDPLTVFIVDDNAFVRTGMSAALSDEQDVRLVGAADNGDDALRQIRDLLPDVVLMDVRMPGMDGIEITRRLAIDVPHCRVLMVTWSDQTDDLVRSILAGAKGYLVHGHFGPPELVEAIKTVGQGGGLITPAVVPQLLRLMRERLHIDDADAVDPLTRREFEILQMIGEGHTNRQIAASLRITEKTVKNHINNIYSKLHVQSRLEARAHAARWHRSTHE